jgi:hypothetical protein
MLTLIIDSQAHLTGHPPGAVADRIKARFTFANPAYLKAEKRGYWTGNIPKEIRGWGQEADRLSVPRGGHGATGGDSAGRRRPVLHRGPAADPG